jgi:ketosteroid isomerase-like protein
LLDVRDFDALVARVYSEDAIDDRQRAAPLRGRGEIAEYFRRAAKHLQATAHLLTNVDVEVDPTAGTATASSRVIACHWSLPVDDQPAARPADFVLLGTYDDVLRRTPDGWQITHRLVGALGPAGLVAGSLPRLTASRSST